MDIIQFDSLFTTFLHPKQFLLSLLKAWMSECLCPRFVIEGHSDLFTMKVNGDVVPTALPQINIFLRKLLVQTIGTTDSIRRTTLVLPLRMVSIK